MSIGSAARARVSHAALSSAPLAPRSSASCALLTPAPLACARDATNERRRLQREERPVGAMAMQASAASRHTRCAYKK